MIFYHNGRSDFFTMKAGVLASLKTHNEKYDEKLHMMSIKNREEIVALLNYICMRHTKAEPAPFSAGIQSPLGGTFEPKHTDDEDIPDCVPDFIRKAMGHISRAESAKLREEKTDV